MADIRIDIHLVITQQDYEAFGRSPLALADTIRRQLAELENPNGERTIVPSIGVDQLRQVH